MDDSFTLLYDRIKNNTSRIEKTETLAQENDKSMAVLVEHQRHFQQTLSQLAVELEKINERLKALETTAQKQEGAMNVVRFLFDKKTLIGGSLAYLGYVIANSPIMTHLIS